MKLIGDIGIWEKVVPKDLCEDLMGWFDTPEVLAKKRDDRPVTDTYKFLYDRPLRERFGPILRDCGDEYFKYYGHDTWRKQCQPIDMKIQKTTDGQKGYQGIHWEQGEGMLNAPRFAAWMAYLNDVPYSNGGRTVFPLQSKLGFRPEMGRMLIWPAAFTHPHHAYPQITGKIAKYVITGWFSYRVEKISP